MDIPLSRKDAIRCRQVVRCWYQIGKDVTQARKQVDRNYCEIGRRVVDMQFKAVAAARCQKKQSTRADLRCICSVICVLHYDTEFSHRLNLKNSS